MKRVRRVRLPLRAWIAMAVPFALLGVGTIGFKATGGPEWTWGDALYMSAITLTTVGYGETHQLNGHGRAFTIVFLFGGVFLLFYSATEMIRVVVSGQLRKILGREGVKHKLEEVHDHIVVCGFGRMGRLICHEFEAQKAQFVLVDQNEDVFADWPYEFGIPVHGDVTSDDILKHAGIERAKVLVAVLPSDADNLYVTLTARVLNPKLFIVARAEQEASEAKLRRVGANQVVSPYVIGGHRVAQAVLRPTVGHFLDQASRFNASDYKIEEATVAKSSILCGKSLRAANLRDDLGVVVIAMRSPEGEIAFNPNSDTVIETGSVVVVVGRREQLDELEKIASGRSHSLPGK
ncbi:MAG TPA: potassium channel protein [Gemmataceae bacterium]|jgi:voltage-gated potassium channel|nr:potassium channel protein [Gemmataceae bacterium]